MKSLDISFHRLQHGLAIGTRVFHGWIERERLVKAPQRLVTSAQEDEGDAHANMSCCVVRIDVYEPLQEFQHLVVALLLGAQGG